MIPQPRRVLDDVPNPVDGASTAPPRPIVRRPAFIAFVLLLVLIVLSPFALRAAGTWLVIDEPVEPARAVVVVGGQVPFRAMEAAGIYKRGLVGEVWLTKGGIDDEDTALAQLGVDRTPEYVYSHRVLERLEVPGAAIHVLPGLTPNTADEIREVARGLKERGGERVILVTSKYHTRRVRMLWHKLVGERPQAIVRYTPLDPFEPERWFRTSEDIRSVWREWFGLLNASVGFPISSERW